MPSRLAPRWLAWQRQQRGAPAAPFGAALAGLPFLTDVFGPLARVIVEIAFGANLKGEPGYWPWWDVTTDVRQADGNGITISPMGRGDEFSTAQPAQCSFELDNPAGDYSKSQASKWWPFILRRNTPVRVRVTLDGNSWYIRFQGQITGMPPTYDTAGRMPIVTVKASGKMQQLIQGKKVIRNILTRYHLNHGAVAVWPFDDGHNSTQAANAVPGGPPIVTLSSANFGNDVSKVFPAVGTAAVLRVPGPGTDVGSATINAPLSGVLHIDLWRKQAAEPDASETQLLTVDLNDAGTWTPIEIRARMSQISPPVVAGYIVRVAGSAVMDSTVLLPSLNPFDDAYHNVHVQFLQAGSNVNATLIVDGVTADTHTFVGATLPSLVKTVHLRNAIVAGSGIGDFDNQSAIAINTTPAGAPSWTVGTGLYAGETATARLIRLFAEEGVPLDVIGTSDTPMGPQGIDTFMNLARECEAADLGMLGDGRGPGCYYVTRQFAYSRPPDLTLDASLGQLDDPLEPEDDDQRNRNLFVVTRKNGSNVTVERADGPLGTSAIGVYDSTPGSDLNLAADSQLPDIGSWLTNEGTVAEPYRYPSFNLDLAAVPAIARAWLEIPFMGRVEAINISSVVPQHPAGSASLILEGYGEFLSPTEWTANGNCAPYAPNRVIEVAVNTGDTGEFITWVAPDKGAMTLLGEYPAGSTSLTIRLLSSVPGNTFDSMIADDFPLDLDVGGRQVTLTAVAAHTGTPGSGGTQVLTVQPTQYALHDGDAIDTWNQNVTGL